MEIKYAPMMVKASDNVKDMENYFGFIPVRVEVVNTLVNQGKIEIEEKYGITNSVFERFYEVKNLFYSYKNALLFEGVTGILSENVEVAFPNHKGFITYNVPEVFIDFNTCKLYCEFLNNEFKNNAEKYGWPFKNNGDLIKEGVEHFIAQLEIYYSNNKLSYPEVNDINLDCIKNTAFLKAITSYRANLNTQALLNNKFVEEFDTNQKTR